jgi:hypothetical protein
MVYRFPRRRSESTTWRLPPERPHHAVPPHRTEGTEAPRGERLSSLASAVAGAAHLPHRGTHRGDRRVQRSSDMNSIGVILKRFESPDETRTMVKGKFEIVRVGGMTIGRATYEPGWKWSEHVGPSVGAKRCSVEHVGMVVSGSAGIFRGRRPQLGNQLDGHGYANGPSYQATLIRSRSPDGGVQGGNQCAK